MEYPIRIADDAILVEQVRTQSSVLSDTPTQGLVRNVVADADIRTLALTYGLLDYRLRQPDVDIRIARSVLRPLRDLITKKMIIMHGSGSREVYMDQLRAVLGTGTKGFELQSAFLKSFFDATRDIPHAFRHEQRRRRNVRLQADVLHGIDLLGLD